MIRVKLPIQKIGITMDLLTKVDPFPAPPYFGQLAIFLHDSQDRLGIAMDSSVCKPLPHAPVAICLIAFFLAFFNCFA